MVQGKARIINELLALTYVTAASPDTFRNSPPVETIPVEDFADDLSTWNLDVINATDFGFDDRQVTEAGEGVYVAVLDTGLTKNWRDYFPEERIAGEYASYFGGGGGRNRLRG